MLKVMRLTFAIWYSSFYYYYNRYNADWRNNEMEKRKLVTPNDIKTALKEIGRAHV